MHSVISLIHRIVAIQKTHGSYQRHSKFWTRHFLYLKLAHPEGRQSIAKALFCNYPQQEKQEFRGKNGFMSQIYLRPMKLLLGHDLSEMFFS